MTLSVKVDSFQYTSGSTSNIVLSGWGFQPKSIIVHWSGIASASDSIANGNIHVGWGFATGSGDQRCANHTSDNAAAAGAASNYHRNDAVLVIANSSATLDGYITVSSFDSGGVTFAVPDAISVDLSVIVIAVGGTDITNVVTGQDTDNSATGNKSNTAIGWQPTIMFFLGIIDGNTTPPGGSNSEGGIVFGAAISSSKQYTLSEGTDDGSVTMDTGSYIYNGEFFSSCGTGNPLNIFARKSFVSMDASGFTWNQLELPETAGSIFHFLAIQGGNWDMGDLLTQTDTTTTVTESGLTFAPALVIMASANRALSTQNAGTTNGNLSFGAATASAQYSMAIKDENGIADSDCAQAVDYDKLYLNIDNANAIQGNGSVTAWNSDGFGFIMSDADPAQSFTWWVTVGSVAAASAQPSKFLEPYPYIQSAAVQRANI